jgi:hypothetical protein
MQFRLEIPIQKAPFEIEYGHKIVSMGSCFSEHVGNKLSWYGFEVLNNPFGTLFHPSAIAALIRFALSEDPVDWRLVQRDDVFLSMLAHSDCFGYSEEQLREKLNDKRSQLRTYLAESALCIITFGTAWGYYQQDEVVANCHKIPANQFEKKMTDLEVLNNEWVEVIRLLRVFNPALEVVFTVSPVRHIKDGVIENQQAKSRLIELVHALPESHYFPAYEIMMDELRDYRFYTEDLVHPTQQAIDYVFSKFSAFCVHTASRVLFPEIAKLRVRKEHKLMFTESEKARLFEQETSLLITSFCQRYPKVNW